MTEKNFIDEFNNLKENEVEEMTKKNFIDEFKNLKDIRPETAEKIKSHNLPVIIFGAARFAKLVTEDLANHDIKVSGYAVDEKYYKPDKTFLGQPIYNFDEIKKQSDKYVFVLGGGTNFNGAIRAFNFMKDDSVIRYSFCLLEIGSMNKNFILENANQFFTTFNMLEDDESKKIMLAFLKMKITNDVSYIYDNFDLHQYFNDVTFQKIGGGQCVYVDCGAFDGDSVKEFINFVGGDYKKIFAIEADKNNFEELKKFVAEKIFKNIECVNCGVWNEKTNLSFDCREGNGDSSSVSENGNLIISADKIDNIVGDEKVTFIKMDIEGAELNALKGAAETIKKFTPTLAICVYHKSEDLITIPQLIKNLNPNYKFYLRHHCFAETELVLYAIP